MNESQIPVGVAYKNSEGLIIVNLPKQCGSGGGPKGSKQMNKRIRELAEQAGMVRGGYANGTDIMTWRESFDNPGSLQKFAELIVRECVKVMYDNAIESKVPPDIDKTPTHYAAAILEHFGAKE